MNNSNILVLSININYKKNIKKTTSLLIPIYFGYTVHKHNTFIFWGKIKQLAHIDKNFQHKNNNSTSHNERGGPKLIIDIDIFNQRFSLSNSVLASASRTGLSGFMSSRQLGFSWLRSSKFSSTSFYIILSLQKMVQKSKKKL